jgi:hypothetical protein
LFLSLFPANPHIFFTPIPPNGGLRKETVYQVLLGGFRGDKIKKLFKSFFKMYPFIGTGAKALI